MAYDVGVRKELINNGIADNRIGYDNNTKNVLIDNQPFFKPQVEFNGTTFTDQPTFNNALNNYKKANPNAFQAQPNPYQPTDYGSQYNDLIGKLTQQVNTPQTYDPYSSPQYAAARAQQNRVGQQNTRQAQEAFGQSGFGRSTNLSDRIQRNQTDSNNYLATQIVPSIIAQHNNEQQQKYQNLTSLINTLMTADQNQKSDQNQQFNQQIALSGITGNYTDPQTAAIQRKMAENSAAYNTATPEQQAQLHAENLALAAQIGQKYDTNAGTYSGDTSIRTLEGQAADAKAAQDRAVLTGYLPDGTPTSDQEQKILDNEWKLSEHTGVITPTLAQLYGLPANTPTYEAKQDAIKNTLDNQRVGIEQQNANTSSRNADTSAFNASTSRINAKTSQNNNSLSQTKYNDSQNANNYESQVVDGLNSFTNAKDAMGWLNANAKDITSKLGTEGFDKIKKTAQAFYPEETKADPAIRSKAVTAAMNDQDWYNANPQEREALIQKYMSYYQGQ